jgi:formylglycine-generating enzyme required for sulfatase activity
MKTSITLLVVSCLSLSCFAVCPSMDFTGDCRVDLADFAMFAEQWLTEGSMEIDDIVWIYTNDPGVFGHEGFSGYMSKYETTNAQYCQYLNAALASGDITVNGSYVVGASGSNPGTDFAGQNYYYLDGEGVTDNGATNGGAARINWTGNSFTVDSGFEIHPVTYVSWYGARAFASYYGWRLPTEWEWQAVADFNGSYTYGCGTSINNSKANYYASVHPYGTTPVGMFGTYGYGMCDMAGNVWEWTNSVSGSYSILRGGGWMSGDNRCLVSDKTNFPTTVMFSDFGFRVCRDTMEIPDIVWVSINDPGVSGHEGFSGYMSKYETTNAQYCQYLNAALASGDITVNGSYVVGASGSNPGADFAGQNYYYLAGEGFTYNGATNGGAARINWTGSSFTVDSGFENHPVTYVSLYGARVFASYYGWRLPTEWEWQAVADFNGSYTYGCGPTINNSIANYKNSTHPHGTTPVGLFGTYGYGMCDMAGNVKEWTSSIPVLRGGDWISLDSSCTVSFSFGSDDQTSMTFYSGFRVCH